MLILDYKCICGWVCLEMFPLQTTLVLPLISYAEVIKLWQSCNNLLSFKLYGKFDSTTNLWVDGLFTKMLRNITLLEDAASLFMSEGSADKVFGQIQQWFVMDGSIDDSWITPFESLLDYSKQFVLGNRKRVTVSGQCFGTLVSGINR